MSKIKKEFILQINTKNLENKIKYINLNYNPNNINIQNPLYNKSRYVKVTINPSKHSKSHIHKMNPEVTSNIIQRERDIYNFW